MFFSDVDRIFPGAGGEPGREQWFFRAREGVNGPYPTQEEAIKALRVFVKHCVETGRTGGRSKHWSVPP